ncbi:AAA family ATPase [Corynebacterium cystitidis]|uniref:AAA family ATPase n=1 Tax=Corynebacterium cystitidis TaxID=35757 RepID=UPI00211F31FA|nr:AAA family ATPase [Corynebacterium cystitidis]
MGGIGGFQFSLPIVGDTYLRFFTKGVDGSSDKKKGEVPDRAVAIVYGKNGSGKSTIAQALREEKAIPLDDSGKPKQTPLSEVGPVRVFDTDYIDRNVRLNEDENLNAIILLGQDAADDQEAEDVEQELADLEPIVKNMEEALEEKKKDLERTEQILNSSLKFSATKEQWANRAAALRGKNSVNVTKDVIKSIHQIDPEEFENKESELLETFNDTLRQVQDASKQGPCDWKPPQIPSVYDEKSVTNILKEVPPHHDQEEDSVENRLETLKLSRSQLEEIRDTFDDARTFCPTCTQAVTDDHKKNIVIAVNKILRNMSTSSVSQKAEKEISEVPSDRFDLELPEEIRWEPSFSKRYEEAKDAFVQEIDRITALLKQKVDNPDSIPNINQWTLDTHRERLADIYEEAETVVNAHNKTASSIEDKRESLEKINYQLAALECREHLDALTKSENKRQKADQKLEEKKKDKRQLKSRLNTLRANENQEAIALEKINSFLDLVFGPSRLNLAHSDQKGYRVLSRGNSILPSQLSTGEQNVLALCYFLVETKDQETFDESLTKSQLIVLDDPISSFDSDNKYGMVKLLSLIFRKILAKDSRTNVLLLTHDISVAYDLSKITSNAFADGSFTWEYRNNKIVPANFSNYDVYVDILERMYRFGIMQEEGINITSNEVRRIWEAFVRFEVGENPTDAANSKAVREFLSDLHTEYKIFLDAFPGRVFINPDSHSTMNIQTLDFQLRPTLPTQQQQHFVAEILVFIHLISPIHIPSRLCPRFSRDSRELSREDIKAELDKLAGETLSTAKILAE